jgi:hypothetical protein
MEATPTAATAAAERVLRLPLDTLAARLLWPRRGAGRACGADDDDDDDEGIVDKLGIRRGEMDGCERVGRCCEVYMGARWAGARDDAGE